LDGDLNEVYMHVGTNARVTIVIDGTPNTLMRDSVCKSPTAAGNVGVPSNVTTWGNLAAQIVHHIDQQTYSAIVEAYEIYNEPDGPGMCFAAGKDSQQLRLHDYKSIYAAAAPAIKTQLSSDLKSALVGGPALCCQPNAVNWFSTGYPIPPPGSGTEAAFLKDTTTGSHVDFVSAHHYGTSASNWATEFNSEQAVTYRNFANDVYGYIKHGGLNPNAPFWINEYDSGVGTPNSNDGCRFAACNGLFQGVFIADQIARVYDTNHGMARTWMFALNHTDPTTMESHCMFGTATAGSPTCVSSTYPPMPNYYALELINGTLTDGLDLGSGGSATQNYSTGQPSDTVTAGWYNASGNHFYIVNSGTSSYTITFVFKNTGYVTWTGAGSHLWDSVNGPTFITDNSITMTKSNTSDWTTSGITLPPKSILGVGFHGQ
jgi:hypothetical protein